MTLPPTPPPLPRSPSTACIPLQDLEMEYRYLVHQLGALPPEVPALSADLQSEAERATRIMQKMRSLEKNNLELEEVRTALITDVRWMNRLNLQVKHFVYQSVVDWVHQRINLAARKALEEWQYDASAMVVAANDICEEATLFGDHARTLDDIEVAYSPRYQRLMNLGNNLHKKIAQHRMQNLLKAEIEEKCDPADEKQASILKEGQSLLAEAQTALHVDQYYCPLSHDDRETIVANYNEKVLALREKLQSLINANPS